MFDVSLLPISRYLDNLDQHQLSTICVNELTVPNREIFDECVQINVNSCRVVSNELVYLIVPMLF